MLPLLISRVPIFSISEFFGFFLLSCCPAKPEVVKNVAMKSPNENRATLLFIGVSPKSILKGTHCYSTNCPNNFGRSREEIGLAILTSTFKIMCYSYRPIFCQKKSEAYLKRRVLFLCETNGLHSPIAEALLARIDSEHFEAISAGTSRGGLHPLAVEVMNEVGIDLSGKVPRFVQELGDEKF